MPDQIQELTPESPLPDNHSAMFRMGPEGDVKKMWDRTKPEEVEDARKTFNDLKKKGYKFYDVGKDGKQGEPMAEFNAQAEKMIGVPALQGG